MVCFQTNFHDKTPYTIMFGPDKCGNDHKVTAISDLMLTAFFVAVINHDSLIIINRNAKGLFLMITMAQQDDSDLEVNQILSSVMKNCSFFNSEFTTLVFCKNSH